MTSNYLINMDDGRLVFRNPETDAQVNLKPVSDDIVARIVGGELAAMDVVNAISAKVKEDGDFNLSQYIEEVKKLNVRKSNPQGRPVREALKDRSDEEVSVDDVKAARDKSARRSDRRERARKANAAVSEMSASPFAG